MPMYEYRMRRLRTSLRADPEILGSAGRRCARTAASTRCRSCCRARPFSSRVPAGTSPITREGLRRGPTRRRRSRRQRIRKTRSRTESKSSDRVEELVDRVEGVDKSQRRRTSRSSPTPAVDLDEHAAKRLASSLLSRAERAAALDVFRAQVGAERLAQIRPPQREVHHRLQVAELVAGVVARPVDFTREDLPLLAAVCAVRW